MRRVENQLTGVITVECDTWADFVADLQTIAYKANQFVYRGQAASDWKLQSVFERWLERVAPGHAVDLGILRALTGGQVQQFRALTAGLLPGELRSADDVELWAIGRHHGLVTPLLDWTRSPFVAAYFAFRDFAFREQTGLAAGFWGLDNVIGRITVSANRVAVWGMDTRDVFVPDEFERLDPLPYSNARQRAQQGLFTRLTHAVFRDVESYLADRGLAGDHLIRWTIPGTEIDEALFALRQMTITVGTLFPDLAGAAEEVNLANMWSTFGPTPGGTPPFVVFGTDLRQGDVVEVVVGGVTCARATANSQGQWLLYVDEGARGVVRDGVEMGFRLNGEDVGAIREVWRSGGGPRDPAAGVSLRSA
ncbi:MAG: FRG domain-containing protein [Dehalococcoidia bacterium]